MHNICSPDGVNPELEHLQETFEANGYPTRVVQGALEHRRRVISPQVGEQPKKLLLPYVRGLSERIERLVRPLNIRTVFKTQTTLRHRLMRVKGKPDRQDVKWVICSVPCECGDCYIGETGRNLKTRLTEHKRAVRNADTMQE